MSDKPIEKMNFEELRREVQVLSDKLAKMKRFYEDALENLDDDNFSSAIIKEKDGMKAEIKIAADEISTKVSSEDLATTLLSYSTISQTASAITSTVTKQYITDKVSGEYVTPTGLSNILESYSTISQTAEAISGTVTKQYITNKLGNEYVTSATAGLTISVDNNNKGYIKVYTALGNNESGAIFNKDGLRFYDYQNQFEGWAIEPDSSFGGLLKYYINDNAAVNFGARGLSGTSYSNSDIVLKALSGSVGRFVVDLSSSGNKEIKFVGLSEIANSDTPYIYANEKLLATQDWVENDAVMYARFA